MLLFRWPMQSSYPVFETKVKSCDILMAILSTLIVQTLVNTDIVRMFQKVLVLII